MGKRSRAIDGSGVRWWTAVGAGLAALAVAFWWQGRTRVPDEPEDEGTPAASASAGREPAQVGPAAQVAFGEGATLGAWEGTRSRLEEGARLLEESVVWGAAGERGKRARLLEVEGFEFPLRVAYALERDPSSGRERAVGVVEMAADRVLAKFREGTTDREAARLCAALGMRLIGPVGKGGVYEVGLSEAGLDSAPKALARVASLGLEDVVEYWEPNYVAHATREPNDPAYAEGLLWGLRNVGQSGGVAGEDAAAVAGWTIEREAPSVVVAIVDTGIHLGHEDLAGNLWVNRGETPGNGIDDDGNGVVDDVHGINAIDGSGSPEDDNGHGSHCAGIAGAVGDNGLGVTGVAWQAQLMGVKFLRSGGSGTLADAVRGIDYAVAAGADVLSNSWGSGGYSQALQEALERAEAAGVAMVAAAGNQGQDIDLVPQYPASFDLDGLLTVAAMDRSGELSPFSNYGVEAVDLAAPGSEIYSTWAFESDAYRSVSGTSMAAPYASGALALLQERFPEAGAIQQLERLRLSARSGEAFWNATRSGGTLNLGAALSMESLPRAPRFAQRPPSEAVALAGEPVVLSAEAAAELPLSYQWYFEGEPLAGETQAQLRLASARAEDAGAYRLEATTSEGSANALTRLEVVEARTDLAAAVEAPELALATFGDADWEVYGFDAYVGESSIRSGEIADGGRSRLRARLAGPGEVTFRWRASSEAFYDGGRFLVDGAVTARISGETRWVEVSTELTEPRDYELEWQYAKDDSVAAGQDGLFVDGLAVFPLGEGPPVIVGQPQGATVSPGASYVLAVSASGEGLRYAWLKDGAAIDGAAGATLRVTGEATAEGVYQARVSNDYGTSTSGEAEIVVDAVPAYFASQPADLMVAEGSPARFSAGVGGSYPLSLQWYRDGEALAGETASELSFESVTLADAGGYALEVSNLHSGGSLRTREAILEVEEVELAPLVVKQPESGYLQSGESIRLSAGVEGSQPIAYQWFKDGEALAGGTERALLIEPAEEGDSGSYFLEARNGFGEARSASAEVAVIGRVSESLDTPQLDWKLEGESYFRNQTMETLDGEDALQSVLVGSGFFGSLSVLSAEVAGPTNFFVSMKQVAQGLPSQVAIRVDGEARAAMASERDWHEVAVPVRAGEGMVSLASLLEVGSRVWLDQARVDGRPHVYRSAESVVYESGWEPEVWVEAFGSGTLAYQWYRDGASVAGATEAQLSLSGGLDGVYQARLSNAEGEAWGPEIAVERLADWELEVSDGTVDFDLAGGAAWRPMRAAEGELHLACGIGRTAGGDLLATVEGPGTLVFDYALQSVGCCSRLDVLLDGERVDRASGGNETRGAFVQRAVSVPEGLHQVTWRFAPGEDELADYLRSVSLRRIRLAKEPVFTRSPVDLRVAEGSDAALVSRAVGVGPLTYQWFKDGASVAGANGAALVLASVDAQDAGAYVCQATDGAGRRAESSPATLRVASGFGAATELAEGRFGAGSERWWPQSEVSWDGEDALEYRGDAEAGLSSLAIDVTVPPGERRALGFWLKIEGLAEGGLAQVSENGEQQVAFRADQDWTFGVLPLGREGTNRVFVSVRHGSRFDGSVPRVWLDGMSLLEEPVFYEPPVSAAARWGDPVALEADVVGAEPLVYRWFKDGEALGAAQGSGRIELGRMEASLAGRYRLEVEGPGGRLAGEPIELALVDGSRGSAVGWPMGLWSGRGTDGWAVSGERSQTGEIALAAAVARPGERQELSWAIEGEGMLSFWWRLDSPSGADQLELRANGSFVSGLYEDTGWRRFQVFAPNGRYALELRLEKPWAAPFGEAVGWLDGIRFPRTGGYGYGQWAESAFEGSGLGAALRAPLADPDGDAVANVAEYALGRDPLAADGLLPTPRMLESNGIRRVALDLDLDPRAEEVAIGYELSRDLVEWYPAAASALYPAPDERGATLLYTVQDAELGQPLFARLVFYYLDGSE